MRTFVHLCASGAVVRGYSKRAPFVTDKGSFIDAYKVLAVSTLHGIRHRSAVVHLGLSEKGCIATAIDFTQ